jgi:hypothetical protein
MVPPAFCFDKLSLQTLCAAEDQGPFLSIYPSDGGRLGCRYQIKPSADQAVVERLILALRGVVGRDDHHSSTAFAPNS